MRTILKDHWPFKKQNELRVERYLNALSAVLVGLGIWLVIDGALSIVKYSKQSCPEHLIRVIRATVGIIIIILEQKKANPRRGWWTRRA